jgi:hypothetical protein
MQELTLRKFPESRDRVNEFFMVSVAVHREGVAGFEGLWAESAGVVAGEVNVLNVIRNVLFSSGRFGAHEANIQVFLRFPDTRFNIA